MVRFLINTFIIALILGNITSGAKLNMVSTKRSSSISDDSLHAIKLNTKALKFYKERKLKQAIDYANASIRKNALTTNHLLNAKNYLLLGRIYRKEGYNHKDALEYYIKAIGICGKNGNTNMLAIANFELGIMFLNNESNDKALEYFKKNTIIIPNINNKPNLPELNYVDIYLKEATISYTKKHLDFASLNDEMTAISYQKLLKCEEAIDIYEKLLTQYRSINNYHLIANTYDQLAKCYSISGNYQLAIDNYQNQFDVYKENYELAGMATAINNVGINYFHLHDYDNAIKSFKTALGVDISVSEGKEEHTTALTNLGICYQNKGEYDNSLKYLNQALEIAIKKEDQKQIAKENHLITLVYFYMDDLHNAEIYCLDALNAAKKTDSPELLQKIYQTYSLIFQEGNDPDRALEYYQKYLSIRDSLLVEKRLKEQEEERTKYETEKEEKNIKLLLKDKEMRDMAIKQMRLEAEKREKELALLKRESELQESMLKQKELEKQRAMQELELIRRQKLAKEKEFELIKLQREKEKQDYKLKEKEREEKDRLRDIALLKSERDRQEQELENNRLEKRHGQIMFGFLFIISILILIGLILTRRKNKVLDRQKKEIHEKNLDLGQKNEEILTQKEHLEEANKEIMAQNEEITTQKDLIEKKNEDITSSISYASRIQEAVLPPEDLIGSYLSDYFVLFRPRDIVSGDFYWMRQEDDTVIIAAADCTGHGVPGAFMSMLGVSFLNEIVSLDHVTEANQVLNELRVRVKTSLRQTGKEKEAKDGMDMALCMINLKDLSMQYAGAYNPIYIIRDNELIQIKADRMPIGIYIKERDSFTNNRFQLQKDDQIYMFSDGYVDQFGGKNAEKFKIKRFKELILAIRHKSMPEQKEILNQTFDRWRNYHEQLDDVLVMGFKIKESYGEMETL